MKRFTYSVLKKFFKLAEIFEKENLADRRMIVRYLIQGDMLVEARELLKRARESHNSISSYKSCRCNLCHQIDGWLENDRNCL